MRRLRWPGRVDGIHAVLICLIVLVLHPAAAAAGFPHPEAPRLLNYYLDDGFVGREDFIARWDVVILDYKHLDLRTESIALIRQYNPQIRILAYIDPMCINRWIEGGPGNLRYDFAAGVDSLWIAYTADGDTISYWENTYHLNVTERCPRVDGLRYRDYFVRFVRDRISPYIDSGLIDGVHLDELSEGSYLWWGTCFDGCFDYDLDHACDPDDSLAVWLNHAVNFFADSTAGVMPAGGLVAGNNCKPYLPSLHGKLFERFPSTWEGGLAGSLNSIDLWSASGPQPRLTAVNGIPANPDNIREFRYRYAGSLLADCYFNYDYDTGDHHQEEWFELFDFNLGLPVGMRYTLGEVCQLVADFESGAEDGVIEVPYMSNCEITDDPDLVLQGESSLDCDVINDDAWPAIVEIRLPGGYAGGSQYTISFLYRVLDCQAEGSDLFLKAQYSASCAPVMSLFLPVVEGAQGRFRAGVALQDCDDYRIFLRSRGDMRVVLDSLTVVEGRGGLLARDYENGVVVCNDSGQPQTLPYNTAWELVDADSQREHYPLWPAGQDIVIPATDGLVFQYDWTEAPEQAPAPAPSALRLRPAAPNPFNPATTIRFFAPRAGKARLELFDAAGRIVARLLDAAVAAGEHAVRWDGRDAEGRDAASGVYCCRLAFEGEARGTRLVLLR